MYWKPVRLRQTGYTITFDANGGSVTPANAVTGAGGELTSLPTPTRSGSYSFDGRYTAASGGTKVTTSYQFTADTTVYAHWTYTGGSSSGGGVSTYAITVDSAKNGDVTVSPRNASRGTTVTLTVELTRATRWRLSLSPTRTATRSN